MRVETDREWHVTSADCDRRQRGKSRMFFFFVVNAKKSSVEHGRLPSRLLPLSGQPTRKAQKRTTTTSVPEPERNDKDPLTSDPDTNRRLSVDLEPIMYDENRPSSPPVLLLWPRGNRLCFSVWPSIIRPYFSSQIGKGNHHVTTIPMHPSSLRKKSLWMRNNRLPEISQEMDDRCDALDDPNLLFAPIDWLQQHLLL